MRDSLKNQGFLQNFNNLQYDFSNPAALMRTAKRRICSKNELIFSAIKGKEDHLMFLKKKANRSTQNFGSCSDTSNEDIPSLPICPS